MKSTRHFCAVGGSGKRGGHLGLGPRSVIFDVPVNRFFGGVLVFNELASNLKSDLGHDIGK